MEFKERGLGPRYFKVADGVVQDMGFVFLGVLTAKGETWIEGFETFDRYECIHHFIL